MLGEGVTTRIMYCCFPDTCALCWWRRVGRYVLPLTGSRWNSILGERSKDERVRAPVTDP
jgi:hypothetical protein